MPVAWTLNGNTISWLRHKTPPQHTRHTHVSRTHTPPHTRTSFCPAVFTIIHDKLLIAFGVESVKFHSGGGAPETAATPVSESAVAMQMTASERFSSCLVVLCFST